MSHKESDADLIFHLLDRDGDGWIEFTDFATYLFSLNERVIICLEIIEPNYFKNTINSLVEFNVD